MMILVCSLHHLCIDADDPSSELDPDGSRVDMGAFYYNQIAKIQLYLVAQTNMHVYPFGKC